MKGSPITPPKNEADRLLDYFSLAAVAGALLLIAFYYPKLPASIPIDFDSAGRPDAYGSKHIMLLLIGLQILIYIGLGQLHRHPDKFNYPVKVTEANAPELHRLGQRLLRGLKAFISGLFTYFLGAMIAITLGWVNGLGAWFLPIFLFSLFGLIGYFYYRMAQVGK
jgi:hypothetical protein